jgi:D-aminopeptidase
VASSTTNVFDDAGIARAVDNSERLAKLAPENPELMPLLTPQTYATVAAAFPATERLDAAARADACGSVPMRA